MPDPRPLYPPVEPFNQGFLQVSPLHSVYFEESGNPAGKPVIFLHGGPGGGTTPRMRRFFHPDAYRIVLMDQRGSGRSRPHAELRENTTWDLVADIERLRTHLGIAAWQVFGGSWGATLALAYAQSHPERVTELVLRGVFTLRRRELEWFYQGGAARLFPDAWEAFVAPIPEAERGDMMAAYHRRLTGDDRETRLAAARAWSTWEGATSNLLPCQELIDAFGHEHFALAFARIESHYFVHGGFFQEDGQLLAGVEAIRHIPGVIVHGRYDAVCPLETAWALHRAWPEARMEIVPDAGHSAFEPGILGRLVEATDRFRP